MSKIVTLIIHGTFSKEAEWWRFGKGEETTFANRLEDELSRLGLEDTVWMPVLEEGLDYSSFSWSGLNRHRDRLRGARKLRSSVNELAKRVYATNEHPLTVNFVAHSHGGNVVLEAIRNLESNVCLGRIVLLGTPLVKARPAFRIARFILSTFLAAFFFLFLMILLIQLGSFIFTGQAFESVQFVENGGEIVRETTRGTAVLIWIVPALIVYGWIFWLLGNLLDVVWRTICRVTMPINWIRGKASSLVYGPSPRKLNEILDNRPILLLTSRNDEADLLLQISSAPTRLYKEYVSARFTSAGRVLEYIFLRPIVLGVFLKAIELFLEVFTLGVSAWKAMVKDFEVASHWEEPYYSYDQLLLERLDVRPKPGRSADQASPGNEKEDKDIFLSNLHLSLQEVARELTQQIQLRHSAYYEDDMIITRIASFLTGDETKSNVVDPPPTNWPESEFWEAVLIANGALTALYLWVADPLPAQPVLFAISIFLGGYAIPLTGLGIGLAISFVLKGRKPDRPGLIFWVIWIVFGVFVLI